ncbi:MAG: MarR family winged helix-turn-helix transcriptional regulator [Vulcanimicrobiaceae bacterium]
MVHVNPDGVPWRLFHEVLHSQKYWLAEVAADLGISPQLGYALHNIPAQGGVTMSELASEMACDRSNATGVIDRLEARGLVERQASRTDRRAICVVLTAAGRRLRKKIDERLEQAPPALAALSPTDQRALRRILETALAHAAAQRRDRAAG